MKHRVEYLVFWLQLRRLCVACLRARRRFCLRLSLFRFGRFLGGIRVVPFKVSTGWASMVLCRSVSDGSSCWLVSACNPIRAI